MKITFDTQEDIEHLMELQALIQRLIDKKGSAEETPSAMFSMFGDTPSEAPQESAPSNAFSLFSEEPTKPQEPPQEEKSMFSIFSKKDEEDKGDYRIVEY